MSMPRDFTVNGIGRLGVTVASTSSFDPLQENSLEFTGLAFAIHAGLSILEKSEGRQALQRIGHAVIQGWAKDNGGFRFGGDSNQMPTYVKEFLLAVRADFPRVIMSDLGGHDVIAQAKRTPGWDGNLFRYLPKKAAGIYYNKTRVSQMALAASQASDTTSAGRKMATRFRTFLFMFAVATAHELTHLFVGYLAQGQDTIDSYTPPEVSYLNYTGLRDRNGRPASGESGRWLENSLFGGSIEFYRDASDDNGQAGIPHILNSNALAIKIHPSCVLQLVTKIVDFRTFPFTTTGQPLTPQQRRAKGLLSLGSTEPSGPQPSGSFMRSRQESPMRLYNISAEELCLIPLNPKRPLRVKQVA